MSRQRDTKAEYRARDERARALGYRSNRERTLARKAARAGDTAKLHGADRPTGIVVRGSARDAVRIVPPRAPRTTGKASKLPKYFTTPAAPGSVVMNSMDARAILARLRAGARAGEYVTIRATYQKPNGQWVTRQVDGYTASLSDFLNGAADTSEAGSTQGDGKASFSTRDKVQLLFTDTSSKQGLYGGVLASDLVDSFDAYGGDFWDWLYDLLESEYF